MSTINILGMMSGTSLDGLDLALCRFRNENGQWRYEVADAACIGYPEEWIKRLQALPGGTALELAAAHAEYGHYLGTEARKFLDRSGEKAGLIASHGHTIFHQPGRSLTFQLGSGAAIAAAAGTDTVCDFRTTDVARHGQGAPLVPIGDELLFSDYDYCLNIGGIANISYPSSGRRLAYDVCPANMVLNHLSNLLGMAYDDGGAVARSGKLHHDLLRRLNELDYYQAAAPKSLGREWVEEQVFPLLEKTGLPPADLLCTFTEHVAYQVVRSCELPVKRKGMLATGGGAFNSFLIERINAMKPELDIRVTDELRETIKFKEAIIFAFLGLLRMTGEFNSLSSVTGANRNSCGGGIYSAK